MLSPIKAFQTTKIGAIFSETLKIFEGGLRVHIKRVDHSIMSR